MKLSKQVIYSIINILVDYGSERILKSKERILKLIQKCIKGNDGCLVNKEIFGKSGLLWCYFIQLLGCNIPYYTNLEIILLNISNNLNTDNFQKCLNVSEINQYLKNDPKLYLIKCQNKLLDLLKEENFSIFEVWNEIDCFCIDFNIAFNSYLYMKEIIQELKKCKFDIGKYCSLIDYEDFEREMKMFNYLCKDIDIKREVYKCIAERYHGTFHESECDDVDCICICLDFEEEYF